MNWLQKAAGVVIRLLNLQDPTGWQQGGADTAAGEQVNETSVLALSAAWACVNLLSGTISSLPLMVYRTDRTGARTVAKDHPLYRVLHDSPNADQTAVDFWGFGCSALELRGNMHALVLRGSGGRIIALEPIGVPVDCRRLSDGSLRYRWTEYGIAHDEPQENVFHVRGFGGNPMGGLSTLTYGREAFGLSMATDRAAASTFRNGLRPSVVIGFKQFLTKEQREVAESRLAEKYAGAMNAGRPMMTEGDQTVTTLSVTPEDAQMLQSRGFSIEEICRFFGVPPFMIGHTEKTTSWGTGLEQQTLGFQKFTLRPRLERIEQAIEKQLLTPQDRAAGLTIEFNVEGLLRGDSQARSTFYQSALTNGWMTINEVRAYENLPPVDGGNVPRMQAQNVPITQAGTLALPAPQLALPSPDAAE